MVEKVREEGYTVYKGTNVTIETVHDKDLEDQVDYIDRKILGQSAFKRLIYVEGEDEGYLILDGVGEFAVKPTGTLKFRIQRADKVANKPAAYNISRLGEIDLSTATGVEKLIRAVTMADL